MTQRGVAVLKTAHGRVGVASRCTLVSRLGALAVTDPWLVPCVFLSVA